MIKSYFLVFKLFQKFQKLCTINLKIFLLEEKTFYFKIFKNKICNLYNL